MYSILYNKVVYRAVVVIIEDALHRDAAVMCSWRLYTPTYSAVAVGSSGYDFMLVDVPSLRLTALI